MMIIDPVTLSVAPVGTIEQQAFHPGSPLDDKRLSGRSGRLRLCSVAGPQGPAGGVRVYKVTDVGRG